MLFDGHLQVQPYELAHMPMREGIFSSEDWSDFEDTLEIAHNAHLLVKLRGLGKASFFVEVAEVEDIGTTL